MPKAMQGLRTGGAREADSQADISSLTMSESPTSPSYRPQPSLTPREPSGNGEREYSPSSYRQGFRKAVPRRPVIGTSDTGDTSLSGQGSTSDLPLATDYGSMASEKSHDVVDDPGTPSTQHSYQQDSADPSNSKRNPGRALLTGINRTRSGRAGEDLQPSMPPAKPKSRHNGGREGKKKFSGMQPLSENTVKEDRKFKDTMNWGWRNRSGDRGQSSAHGAQSQEQLHDRHNNNPNNFVTSVQSHSSRVVGGIERAGRGLAGIMRLQREEGSPTRAAEPKEEYHPKIITLPLVEQTRITRITKTLPECMDKTEFWMPALVWRCIDFLNAEACESEGIYRQSGSYTRVKHYAMRFDTELDIDLLSAREKEELGDVNIIASLFKMWIREQPTQVIPQQVQDRVMTRWRTEGEPEEVPQYFKDELSQLPPYHYYLLFAITCHISLVYACREENKMSFHNLHICFAPGLKVDHQVFKWLIENWRDCWQGCLTEEEYIKEEARLATAASMRMAGVPPGSPGRNPEEYALPSSANGRSPRDNSPAPRTMTPNHDNKHEPENSHQRHAADGRAPTIHGTGTGFVPTDAAATQQGHREEPRAGGIKQAPMLSPMRPLDPLGDFMN